MFAEKMKTFLKDSRDQHEVLTSMHKSMEKQYADLGNYFAFKTKTFALEEFFTVGGDCVWVILCMLSVGVGVKCGCVVMLGCVIILGVGV